MPLSPRRPHILWLFPLALLFAVPAFAQDVDGDGWTVAAGDCADSPTPSIPRPELVNPGAFEIPGNGIDDDCDGAIDNPVTTACSAGAVFTGATALNLANALDLCATTTENAPLSLKRWGLITTTLTRANNTGAPADQQKAVMLSYGNSVPPQANATMAVISSGTARDQGDAGYIAPSPGYNSGSVVPAPAAFTAGNGGTVLHDPACPLPNNDAYDSVRLRLRLRVPTNANGLRFAHRWFSAEYPDTCDFYNDHVVCLLTSAHPSTPANRNILFDPSGNPVTVQTARFTHCIGCADDVADLAGTGYGNDGATSWNVSTAAVVPGETIELEFVIWDSSDGGTDGLALFDAFEWSLLPQSDPEPQILSITDVAPDQGGAVRVKWRKDLRERPYDTLPEPLITSYALYRRVDAIVAPALRAVPTGDAALALPPGEWDVLGTYPATLDSIYQTVAPTLCDSTASGVCWSTFFVRAITNQPGVFHDSPLDSGWSVDDIAPGVPQNFAVQPAQGGAALSWQPSGAADFQYFRIYRSADPGFTPSPATLVHATATTSWNDPVSGGWTWKITAVDSHDNESAPAAASATVDVGGTLPRALGFSALAPNPFRGTLSLVIDVPEQAGDVDLALFDLAGRRVRTLMSGTIAAGRHARAWDGRRDDGGRAAPGVYLARLTGAGRMETQRVTLQR